VTTDPLEALRRLCLALPEATERPSHGEPTWFVRDRTTFVTYADHHHDDRLAFWCAAQPGVQEALVASDPERFFRPPYVGHRGWLGVTSTSRSTGTRSPSWSPTPTARSPPGGWWTGSIKPPGARLEPPGPRADGD
jgi:hypothetical protein